MSAPRPGVKKPEVDIRWHEQAACLVAPKDLFFPEDRFDERSDEYREYVDRLTSTYCQVCPAREACLAFSLRDDPDPALRFGEPDGIWAGGTRLDRRRWKEAGITPTEALAELRAREVPPDE